MVTPASQLSQARGWEADPRKWPTLAIVVMCTSDICRMSEGTVIHFGFFRKKECTQAEILMHRKYGIVREVQKNGRVRSRTGDLSHAKGTRYQLRHTPGEVVPSRIELLILALLAPRLNQLGQGTVSERNFCPENMMWLFLCSVSTSFE